MEITLSDTLMTIYGMDYWVLIKGYYNTVSRPLDFLFPRCTSQTPWVEGRYLDSYILQHKFKEQKFHVATSLFWSDGWAYRIWLRSHLVWHACSDAAYWSHRQQVSTHLRPLKVAAVVMFAASNEA